MPGLSPAREILAGNLKKIEDQIRQACAGCGRDPAEIRLVWVSKTKPREMLLEACALGATRLGENKVQEVLQKFPLPEYPEVELHFIGRLQSNKIRKILPLCSHIHSVDSLRLLQKIDALCAELRMKKKVFLQVNTSGEASKAGFSPREIIPALETMGEIQNLELLGFMTIGPLTSEPARVSQAFADLRELLSRARRHYEGKWPVTAQMRYLSMGMSHDFTVAIREGSHYIRIGTELFGTREE